MTRPFPWLYLAALAYGACASPAQPEPAHPAPSKLAPSPAPPAPAAPAMPPEQARALWSPAERVFERRCVVCHGCYDAPCQLKLDSFEGIARGATERKVYDPERMSAVIPTRLFVDAHTPAAWRGLGFHPVLPEGPVSDPRASLLLRMLDLKRSQPWPPPIPLSEAFTFDLDREQTCTTTGNFEEYAGSHPLWGMPYALPAVAPDEQAALTAWVHAGAPAPPHEPLALAVQEALARWEDFFNQPDAKHRLTARYIYEHLFLASLYFEGVDEHTFFRLVRSRTPSGVPVVEIATRRPFDPPEVERFFYRLVRQKGAPLAKTHMPYALSDARLSRYRALFIQPSYEVRALPSYQPEIASNPFRAFEALPIDARYRFMLDEAEFTMMGFIKGPVCRGQAALTVIADRFWVAFVSPDAPWIRQSEGFLARAKDDMDMPTEAGSDASLAHWLQYADQRASYVRQKDLYLAESTRGGRDLGLDTIWDGDGRNPNAALTVFRHFDSATVVKGLVGGPPQSVWLVDYPLLEQIHYLLVAGFDVFGNVAHQLTTRLYMDFLRMRGEAQWLALLPPARRMALVNAWYREIGGQRQRHVWRQLLGFGGLARIRYRTATPENELLAMVQARLGPVLSHRHDLAPAEESELPVLLDRLRRIRGIAAARMPETSFVTLRSPDGPNLQLSVLRDSAHTNVCQIFGEEGRRRENEDALSVVDGFLGAYPNALFAFPRAELGAFVDAVERLATPGDYAALRKRFGVLRTSPEFWAHSDAISDDYHKALPLEAGLFDYNRLDPL
jgi:hypothetical protein